MFSLADDASKVATFHLLEECRSQGFELVDLQFLSQHLESLGAYEVDHNTFRSYLETAIHQQTKWGLSLGELKHKVGVPQSLSTARLTIRRFQERDAASLSAWHCNPEVHKDTLVEPLANEHQALAYSHKAIQGTYEHGIPDPMALCFTHDISTVIGSIGCFKPIAGLPTFELAFDLDPKYWGQGLIVEAGTSFIRFMFENYPVERIQSRCVSENTPSYRVLEKLGMKSEGVLRSAAYYRNQFWDMNYFSVLRSDAVY